LVGVKCVDYSFGEMEMQSPRFSISGVTLFIMWNHARLIYVRL